MSRKVCWFLNHKPLRCLFSAIKEPYRKNQKLQSKLHIYWDKSKRKDRSLYHWSRWRTQTRTSCLKRISTLQRTTQVLLYLVRMDLLAWLMIKIRSQLLFRMINILRMESLIKFWKRFHFSKSFNRCAFYHNGKWSCAKILTNEEEESLLKTISFRSPSSLSIMASLFRPWTHSEISLLSKYNPM